jgi:moderate conductance mechanosensitive channel
MDWGNIFESVSNWIGAHGLQLLLIISLSFLFYQLVKMAISRGLARYVEFRHSHHQVTREERIKRAKTLSGVLTGAIGIFMFGLTVFMILAELDIDIAPLLASAGVLGIAIGFGAQSIIKDTLNGLFILLEGQFNTGDVVKIAGVSGGVEDLNLRRTILRDLDGIVHIIPNGQITTVSNYTHEWARVNLNVPVAYSTDLDKAAAVINRVGRELADDPEFSPMIISAPQVLRVDKFADSAIEIKVLGDVHPMKQWPVTGELRRRLKKAFDEAGIEIPFPHTKLFFDNAQLKDISQLSLLAEASRRPAEPPERPVKAAKGDLPPDTEP